jgi:hypothetical protein
MSKRKACKVDGIRVTMTFQPDEGDDGTAIFHATHGNELLAIVNVYPETVYVEFFEEQPLPEWATQALANEALNALREAAGVPPGDNNLQLMTLQ